MIDGQVCDLGPQTIEIPAFDCGVFADLNAARTGRSLRFEVPPTEANDRLFGRGRDPETATRFNATLHTARLLAEGSLLFEGKVRLLASSTEGYTIELREGGVAWASAAARRRLADLPIEESILLTPTDIVATWNSDSCVKFLPIHRDDYPAQSQPTDLLPAERLLSVDDYHPFLQIDRLVREIFARAGYTVASNFMQSDLFRSLYMSGAYASKDTTAMVNRMGFLAGRLTTVSAEASFQGRIYASPYSMAYSLGNLVESASPTSIDEEGKPTHTFFSNGNCFSKAEDGAVVFTAATAATVAFEYDLHYTTEHRIASRDYLMGFDSLYLGPGSDLRFRLTNRYQDRRGNLSNNYTYRAIVFDHAAGNHYRLRCEIDGEVKTWELFSERAAAITSPVSGQLANPSLDILEAGYWVPYEGDWALYDGYIEECGETRVHLRVATTSREMEAGEQMRFDQLYFYGAEEGMRFTLHRETTLRPRFLSSAGYGAWLHFADMVQLPTRQIELLEAVAHLFNLRFATDEATRTVRIEPYDDFYSAEPVDWRERVDLGREQRLLDTTTEQHEVRSWCYRAGDGAVARWEKEQGEELGKWRYETPSAATLVGEEVSCSPLFAPSLSVTDAYHNAPSALLISVGDRDRTTEQGELLTPLIVCYLGLHDLPEPERWGYPATENRYPLATFHFAGDDQIAPCTLCFEDRDGLVGLHRFYDRQLAEESLAGEVELTLHLAPHDYEALFAGEHRGGHLRSRFRLRTAEGELTATLAEVGRYDPTTGRVKCLFNRCDER